MPIRKGISLIFLATMALALVATTASSAGVTSAGDACFKQVFQKRGAEGDWLVRECNDGAALRYRIAYRAAQTAAASAADITMVDMESIVEVKYRVVGAATLLLDAQAERGGRAYLLHPVEGRPALSVATFHYMSNDEESLAVRPEGRRIRASTSHSAHVFDIGLDGALTRAATTVKRKHPLN